MKQIVSTWRLDLEFVLVMIRTPKALTIS